jgi:predicted Zn-dependent peptidase
MGSRLTDLEGGITVVSEEMAGVRSVALGLWFAVGSRDEPKGLEGMSHFLEHMMFKGTKTRSAKDISDAFEGLGAELNAFTSKEYTCYYSRFLDEHLERAVEVLSDMVQRSLFKRDHVLSEREVVLEEIHLHDDTPDDNIHDVFAQALMPRHPLGRPILGKRETVGSFGSRQTRDYFSTHYRPDRVVVAAAGAVDHDRLVDLIRRYLAELPRGRAVTRRLSAPRELPGAVVQTKDTEQAHICLGVVGLDAKHEERYVLSVMDGLLGGGMSSRLFQEIREKKGLAYSVYCYHSLFIETGAVTVYAGTRPQNAEEVVGLIRRELARLTKEPVGKKELARTKEHLKGQLMLGLESTRNRMTRLGKAMVTHGEILDLDEIEARIEAVDAGAVRSLAKRLFPEERQVLAVVGSFDDKVAARLSAAWS